MESKSIDSASEIITGASSSSAQTLQWIKLETLGEGAFAVVDLVQVIKPVTRILAVKSSPSLSPSLDKEYRILRQFLGCPNIVQCYGHISSLEYEVEYHNLFLDYAPDGDLLDLMIYKYGGKIPESDVISYTRMILEGLCRIHEKGYVHCDVKPENILVYPSHQPGSLPTLKIADFGAAKEPGETDHAPDQATTTPSPFRATPDFMSPESVEKGEITASLDIWSLGCTVVKMMSGKQPWESAKSLEDLTMKIGFSKETPNIPQDMSKAGKDFLMRCFARDPHQRWTAHRLITHPFLFPHQNRTLLTPQTFLLPPHLFYKKLQQVDDSLT
ncbi:hypothetical protein PTKIN_Ptkin13bG0104500 [Pterospermum kingtungense]